MKKKVTTRTTIVIVCLVVALVGYYAFLSNRSRERRADANMTAVQSVLSRDLEKDYPPTPKEVMKYYNEIMKCFYNETCTDEEIEALGKKARELYDAELLENNEEEAYMVRLKADIQSYKDKKRRITSASVAASTTVEKYTVDGFDFARIRCGYNVMEGRENRSVKTVYLLRRDDEKHWKIYGWEAEENLAPGRDEG